VGGSGRYAEKAVDETMLHGVALADGGIALNEASRL